MLLLLRVELWKPRQQWLDLPERERQSYTEAVGPGIGRLAEAGVELIGFAINDEDTPYRSDFRYLAAWTMPGPEQVALLEEAGWQEHFEQVNARGEMAPPPEILADMAAL